MPAGNDLWWVLDAKGRNEDRLAAEVLAAIRDHALPTLKAQLASGR